MSKKKSNDVQSSIENRVYLFKDLAAAFVVEQSDLLAGNEQQREAALRALGDIAHACCVMADSEVLDEDEVAHLIKAGPIVPVADDSDVVLESRTAAGDEGAGKKRGKGTRGKDKGNAVAGRRGWGGGHGGG